MELKKQVLAKHYDFNRYVDKSRWMSYHYQVLEVLKKKPKNVLEIGAGKRVIGPILSQSGISYKTLDIDPELKPDFLASVKEMPVQDKFFDVVCCFQMLEHLPYEDFVKALLEINRVARHFAIISLPDARPLFKFSFYIPGFGGKDFTFPKPMFKFEKHKFDGEHYWEINKDGFSLKKIIADVKDAGFIIENTFRPFENTYHRFFVLKA